MDEISPGTEGTPLPSAIPVLRLAKSRRFSPQAIEQGDLENLFILSSDEKRQPKPRLSVFVEPITSASVASKLLGADFDLAARLSVDDIRALRPEPPEPPCPNLEVEWERATIPDDHGNLIPDMREGAEGHAGIAYLNNGNKPQQKSFRSQLADLARQSIFRIENAD